MKYHLVAPMIFLSAVPAMADPVLFSTGDVDARMAAASRPSSGATSERETADDFVLASNTNISSASFTGLVTSNSGLSPIIGNVVVEIYRVFPLDSTVPPSGNVPTRVNSPSDIALAD